MSSEIYPAALDAIAKGLVDFTTDDVRIQAVSSAYAYSAAHDFLDDVGAGARLGAAVALASKTATNGLAEATSPATVASLAAGDDVVGAILYVHTGTDATARLLAYLEATAPTATNGNDFNLVVSGGLFQIGSKLCPKAAEAFLKGEIDWTTDDVRIQLFGGGYTYSTSHEFLSDVADTIGSGTALSGRAVSGGVLAAASSTVIAAPTDTVEGAVLYIHTGSSATSRLILCYRVGYGLSLDTSGGDVTVTMDTGSNRTARL